MTPMDLLAERFMLTPLSDLVDNGGRTTRSGLAVVRSLTVEVEPSVFPRVEPKEQVVMGVRVVVVRAGCES